jgi:hypothetical protein
VVVQCMNKPMSKWGWRSQCGCCQRYKLDNGDENEEEQ